MSHIGSRICWIPSPRMPSLHFWMLNAIPVLTSRDPLAWHRNAEHIQPEGQSVADKLLGASSRKSLNTPVSHRSADPGRFTELPPPPAPTP
uniref:Uncharacterized protein n=1 Tax=Varanus komodoensis TaxID=61221 RepID=A0A8D2LFW5_VARKO